MKFKISPKLLEKFPETVEYIVIAKKLNNQIPSKWINDMVKEESEAFRKSGKEGLKEPKYSLWEKLYGELSNTTGLKAGDYFASHIALSKRVLAGKDLPNISPVVNLYNCFSIKYGIPFGGEDLSAVWGDMELGFADGSERYLGIGGTEVETVRKGEVVWKDAHSVTCRMWNWRQCERTKLTNSSRDAYFIIDVLDSIPDLNAEAVVKQFAELLESRFGARIDVYTLDKDNPEVNIDYKSKSIVELDVKSDDIYKRLISPVPIRYEEGLAPYGVTNPVAAAVEIFDPKKVTPGVDEFISSAVKSTMDRYSKGFFVDDVISEYRNLLNEYGYPEVVTASENLIKLTLERKKLPRINTVVDIYNSVCIKTGYSIGAHDIKKIEGGLVLGLNKDPKSTIKPVGVLNTEIVKVGDPVLHDNQKVFSWLDAKDSDDVKIRKDTKNILFTIIGNKEIKLYDAAGALKEICEKIASICGGRWVVYEIRGGRTLYSGYNEGQQTSTPAGVGVPSKKAFMKRKSVSLGLEDPSTITERLGFVFRKALKESVDLAKKENPKIFEGTSESDNCYGGFGVHFDFSKDSKFGDFYSVSLAVSASKAYFPASGRIKVPQGTFHERRNLVFRYLEKKSSLVQYFKISMAPNGFINFALSESFLMSELSQALSRGEKYGNSEAGGKRVVLIESPSANPDAPLHAGHLRNLFLGRSLGRILEKVGFKVELDDLVNDKGLKIIQMMWGVKNLADGKTPESTGTKSDFFVGGYYWKAKKRFDEDEKVKAEVRQMQRDWEAGRTEVMELWRRCMKWVYDGHAETMRRIHEAEAFKWYESIHYKAAKHLVKGFLGQGIVEELPDGAVVAKLEDYGLPDAVLLRSDGTALYPLQDVSLTLRKIEKFSPWKAIWVVGSDHVAHFHSLFALLEKLGIMKVDNLYHFAYGMVVDEKGEKIGKGHPAAFADSMLDIIHSEALKVMGERKIEVELDDKGKVAEAVGQGALRYSFLEKDPMKDVMFKPAAALSFTGKSGPYIMYAYSRARSVIEKAGVTSDKRQMTNDKRQTTNDKRQTTAVDRELILKLLSYPEVLLSAANNYAPNILADYLYDVAKLFNDFYEKETIAGAEGAERELRLAMTELTAVVLRDGCSLLGIEVLERM